MCNRYNTPELAALEREWEVSRARPLPWWKPAIGPLDQGPFVKARNVLEVGQWGMIPPSSKTHVPTTSAGKRMSTNNARSEGVAKTWTFRFPWSRGQRCLIPAVSYDEPYWGTGANIWWRFSRADGQLWALAGLWSEWVDPGTGELWPNYTMLTQNCDGHRLLSLMHKPDPKLPPDQQDKRSVVPIERKDWDTWLHGSVEQAQALIQVPPMELFAHGAADPTKNVPLPL